MGRTGCPPPGWAAFGRGWGPPRLFPGHRLHTRPSALWERLVGASVFPPELLGGEGPKVKTLPELGEVEAGPLWGR